MKRIPEWQIATAKSIRQETPSVKTFTLALPNWIQHKAGQHYDVRLRAPDGYQAECSYSIASEPERTGEIDLTVEKIEDGKVSSYMHDVLLVGDQLEVRGPIGSCFVWESSMAVPLLLVAGGSGIVPLMSMIRHITALGSNIPLRLLYSSRTPEVPFIRMSYQDCKIPGANSRYFIPSPARHHPDGAGMPGVLTLKYCVR